MTKKDDKRPVGKGLSVGTVHFVKNVLRSTFEFAIDNNLTAENPVSRTKLPFLGKARSTSLTTEEAKAFVSVRKHFWFGNSLVFQLYTGLRTQELTAIIWDDVDFDKGTLRIERACKRVGGACVQIGSPKSERSKRVIQLAPELLTLLRYHHEAQQEIIKTHRGQKPYGDNIVKDWIKRERTGQTHLYTRTDLIFPKRDGEIPNTTTMEVAFKRMRRRAGIPDERKLRQYDLRHTHASFLFAASVPSIDVAARMGHSLAICEGTYGHPLEERRGVTSKAFTDLVPLE